MSLKIVPRNVASLSITIKVSDSTSTNNSGLTGVAYNTSGLSVTLRCDNEATGNTYTAAGSTIEAGTVGSWSDPTSGKIRFTEHASGHYQLDLPLSRLVASARCLFGIIKGVANMNQVDFVIEIPVVDFWDGVRGGMTALPNAAGGAAHGLVLGSAAYELGIDSAGKVAVPDTQKVDVNTIKTQTLTCAAAVTILASVGTASTSTAQTADCIGYSNKGLAFNPSALSVNDHVVASTTTGLVAVPDTQKTYVNGFIGTALTETGAGYIELAFKKLFDVVSATTGPTMATAWGTSTLTQTQVSGGAYNLVNATYVAAFKTALGTIPASGNWLTTLGTTAPTGWLLDETFKSGENCFGFFAVGGGALRLTYLLDTTQPSNAADFLWSTLEYNDSTSGHDGTDITYLLSPLGSSRLRAATETVASLLSAMVDQTVTATYQGNTGYVLETGIEFHGVTGQQIVLIDQTSPRTTLKLTARLVNVDYNQNGDYWSFTTDDSLGIDLGDSILCATLPLPATEQTFGISVQAADIQARLPAALTTNGNIKSSLFEILTTNLAETVTGHLAAAFRKVYDVLTGSTTATANTIAKIADISTAALDCKAADHNLTGTIGAKINAAAAAPTAADNAAAVLDVAGSAHNTAGTIGAKINASGSAADPLTNLVPGSYAAGTAGNALGSLPTADQIGSGPKL